MSNIALNYEDYSHAEKLYPDLLFIPESGFISLADREKRKDLQHWIDESQEKEKAKVLCWSCGWSAFDEMYAEYGSRIRIVHTSRNIGLWQIGSRWMVRDQPNDASVGNDFITQEFLRNQAGLSIPLLKEMRLLSAPTDPVCLTLMSRAQGVGLNTIWASLSTEQKKSYSDQLTRAMKQWRQFTSSGGAMKVDGSLLDDGIIGACPTRQSPTCKKVGRTNDQWFKNIEKELRFGLSLIYGTKDSAVIEAKLQKLKDNFPKAEPYVLSHCDLNFSNIIVHDGKIEAIIDWEFAGYLPWWVERWYAGYQDRDLFAPLWLELDRMDSVTFMNEVAKPVQAVISAYRAGISRPNVLHPKSRWARPGFCSCKPYAGYFSSPMLGNKLEHKFNY
ncbi:hypothetical protein BKA65DRAFT_557621 [Rhexocercosporidium sp. MPI-PUGE-AT-0058]|nr:hypothetical protein BKA65DRAFT_557621 [Rhexocercosporidium sp. MPI-PUGE-AT-0058]